MKSRSKGMLEKSIAAMISAIEIYNKPDFKYREESFSVLCINAWELLLKAKVLQLSGNKLTSLFVWEKRQLKDKSMSVKLYRRFNRSGNPMSISLFEAYRIIVEDYGVEINNAVKDNITALTEIRDNSIHFINDDLLLSTKIQEIGTASLQNYLHIVKKWFGDVLSSYNFYLMPISFFRDFTSMAGQSLNSNEKKILSYIRSVEEQYDKSPISDYNMALKIDVNFKKVKSDDGIAIRITNDDDAPALRITEEDMLEKYPWDYKVLTTRLKKRYSNFVENKTYHELRKKLSQDSKLCYQRPYNPSKPHGSKKSFYNPNILREFDKYYEKITHSG